MKRALAVLSMVLASSVFFPRFAFSSDQQPFGTVNPLARPEFDIGSSDPNLPMERIVLLLELRPGGKEALENFLGEVQRPGSPSFHQWITPDEFGKRFGISDDDIQRASTWLQSEGFRIDDVAKGRGWIHFTGTASQVSRAFKTEVHDFVVNGDLHHANVSEPSLPPSLKGIVRGIVSLNDFAPRHLPLHENLLQGKGGTPAFDSGGGGHFLAPDDFATIYSLNGLFSSGINGTGATIAAVGRSQIHASDVQSFRSRFGLSSANFSTVLAGPDPGVGSDDLQSEAAVDVELAGAVARNALVKLVISANTNATSGELLAAQSVVDGNFADVLSISFGLCETNFGQVFMGHLDQLFSQAAAQGITSVASSGDSGAAMCDLTGNSTAVGGRAVNGYCSSPNTTCVGGTQFNDTANPSLYWASSNHATTQASAISYIPEVAWNESIGQSVDNGLSPGLWSSGGGQSNYYAKPSWQTGPGVTNDGSRDVPDVSLQAAGHDAFLFVTGGAGSLFSFRGTSASAPSFAGIVALLVQKFGSRQGNINPRLYQLGKNQYSGTGQAVFHDITSGGNSVPGQLGFAATPGYDVVTGLGSINATSLATNWSTQTGSLPDLVPYQPAGWSDKIVVTKVTGSTSTHATDASPITTSDALYLNWAVSNNGNGSAGSRFYADIYVDGIAWSTQHFYLDPPLAPTYFGYWNDIPFGSLSAGTHTVRIVADSTSVIPESNENNNQYVKTITVAGPTQPCVPGGQVLCLANGRFKVSAAFQTTSSSGTATAIPLTGDTGAFWFFSSSNYEMIVKVLNGCGSGGNYWVFAGGLTNVRVTLTVTDTKTGAVKTYVNPQGVAFQPIQDTAAFSTCP